METRPSQVIIPQEFKNVRVDKVLVQILKDLSRVQIVNMIKKGLIIFDTGQVLKPSYKVKGGEILKISYPQPEVVLRKWNYKLKIIYEDDDIIVVDKPAGLLVHPTKYQTHYTLVNALLNHTSSLSHLGTLRPGIVHRLDKDTSGVMVVAKNDYAHHLLAKQFLQRKVKKEYLALTQGIFSKKEGVIDLPLKKTSNPTKMKISFVNSKKAVTIYRVLKEFRNTSLVKLCMLSGRMHQIRVHLKFLGHPIIGDSKYGSGGNFRLCLHSYKLGFIHPCTQEYKEFLSPLPQDFKKVIDMIK